jgi:hypothetical protein
MLSYIDSAKQIIRQVDCRCSPHFIPKSRQKEGFLPLILRAALIYMRTRGVAHLFAIDGPLNSRRSLTSHPQSRSDMPIAKDRPVRRIACNSRIALRGWLLRCDSGLQKY